MADRLFKYTSSRHLAAIVERGELLFRNLSYYQGLEDEARGDGLEGTHVDHPDTAITITNLTTGKVIQGDFAFQNRIEDSDRIYCFCMSKELNSRMYEDFNCDCCIEITDTPEFLNRWKKVARQMNGAHWQLLNRSVTYYNKTEAIDLNIKDPRNLPFVKLTDYEYQDEYRLVAGEKDSFELTQQIVTTPSPPEDLSESPRKPEKLIFKLGDLRDIALVHYA